MSLGVEVGHLGVDLGTAEGVRSQCPRLHIAVAIVINITGRGLSHVTPQSIMPSLNHCDPLMHVGVNNWHKVCYSTAPRPGIELATCELQVQRLSDSATEPPR